MHFKNTYKKYHTVLYNKPRRLFKMRWQDLATVRTKLALEKRKINLSTSFIERKRVSTSEALMNISFLISLYISQLIITWSSFSTQFLQNGQNLCCSVSPSYLPVSMRSGATPDRNLLKADLCFKGNAILHNFPFQNLV